MAKTPDGDRSIAASALHREFGELRALDGIDLEIPNGQIFGFLGPNGAGKSSTWCAKAARCARPSASHCRMWASTPS